ncbi:FG-GAP repeat domain-containing protein [Actinacidiphila acidipaludis]|uniref:VCBS repeat-containing protein n=1 Tax=Actinacidiphila acidipaludis TaxID=2873382 RepID=A0ABS7QGB7_9ACTN|nr:VCBS repeat-containing protein [Streptomyces acidipaludis]MBY8882208.1 VCBS repeat-containing protein [Streptomyces acidipaludis]
MTVRRSGRHGFRRWAVGAAATLLVGSAFAALPAAAQAADGATPAPSGLAVSPTPVGGADSDGCGANAPYGYIGRATGITFSATSNGTPSVWYDTEFLVEPGDGSAPYDYTRSGYGGSARQLTPPSADFADGVTYTWRTRDVDQAGAASAWSGDCHFTVDLTPPATPVITSKVFPPTGSTAPAPPVRTTGTFTFKVSGPGAQDTVRFEYALDRQLAVGGNASVPVGSDGTARVKLTPTQWGTNYLNVQTVDRAGNVSGTVRYSFLVASAPTMDRAGDLNGDGQADLLATGADGKLYVLYGKGDGTLKKAVTYADTGDGWDQGGVLRDGDVNGDGYQDLLRISATGYVTGVPNNGLGDFGTHGSSTGPWSRADGTSWTAATQILHGTSGSLGTSTRFQDILTVENGQLLHWAGGFDGMSSTVLATGLEHSTVITPGDMTGDGIPDVLIRDDATGTLTLAAADAAGTLAAPADRTTVGTGFTAARYPRVLSAGDANGDGIPDLYAATRHGGLKFFAGLPGGGFAPAVGAHGGLDWTTVVAAD